MGAWFVEAAVTAALPSIPVANVRVVPATFREPEVGIPAKASRAAGDRREYSPPNRVASGRVSGRSGGNDRAAA